MPLERGGKRGRRTEVARMQRGVAEFEFQDACRGLALDVANLFVDAQLARESLRLAKENLAYFESIVEVNKARLKAGDIAEVELLRSRLALSQQRNVVRDAESKYRSALSKLQTKMGRGAPVAGLELDGDLRRDANPPVREQALQLALARRPDLAAARQDLTRAGAEVNSQLAQAKADPTVGTEYRRQQGVNGTGNSMGFFIALPLQVYNRNQGEIERARQERRQTELKVRQLEIEIAGEVDVAHEEATTSAAMLRNVEGEMLNEAQEVRRVTEYSYRRGHVTLLELLDAQRAYNETVQGAIEARAAYARSLFELDAVTGRTVTQ
jgi:cobalt-zinc-cadmium efflux system outer membrane protein